MANTADYFAGVRDTALGTVIGAAGGSMSEFVADELMAALGLGGADIAGDVVNVVVRSAVATLGYIMSDRLMRRLQGNAPQVTEGIMFTFFFVETQPGLIQAGNRLAVRLRSLITSTRDSAAAFGRGVASGATADNSGSAVSK